MARPRVLLVQNDAGLAPGLTSLLAARGLHVAEAHSVDAMRRRLGSIEPLTLLIVQSSLERADDGLVAGRDALSRDHRLCGILLATQGSEELAVSALRAGFSDYFRRPLQIANLLESIDRCLNRGCGMLRPSDQSAQTDLIGDSGSMREVRSYLFKVAATDASVLITGETGTGKELAAEMIHRNSSRRGRPFVRVNCAAIPDALLESELFGYERGAFTGADLRREGTLQQADGGTIFFDEVGDMSLAAQAKVLRAIEAKQVRRLGSDREQAVDVRVLSATNRDLEQLMTEQRFRPDLFFRLHVARVNLPPLRARKEDLLPLSNYYIDQMNTKFRSRVAGFDDDLLPLLFHYDWPGNVRELKNMIEATFISAPEHRIEMGNLPDHFRKLLHATPHDPKSERDRLLSVLVETNWNKSRAAQRLNWSRMTLYRKMSQFQVAAAPAFSKSATKTRSFRATLENL